MGGFPCHCNRHDWDRFDILDDLVVMGQGVIEDAKGFLVASNQKHMEPAFSKKELVLWVLGQACLQMGELVQDQNLPATDVVSLTLIDEPGEGVTGGHLEGDLACKLEH